MTQPEHSICDLLIIGAGPAGLMAATWAARCGINARIIDKNASKVSSGQADGLQSRTLEIFDSFGFADRVCKEGSHMLEACFWNPDASGIIRRTDRIPNNLLGESRFQEVVLHQGYIERFFLESLEEYSSIRVERAVLPEELEFDNSKSEDYDAYPIKVKIRRLDDERGNLESKPANSPINGSGKDDTRDLTCKNQEKVGLTEIIKAKYMIGCDGAHSWTRRQLGFTMEGEQTDFIWGVLDIIPITDFPDIRVRCAIHSATAGSVMVIPREKGLVRLYIQLNEVQKGRRLVERSEINPEMILRSAQRIMSPYQLTYEYCDWWTAYQIGQRIGNHFSASNRIFLAGDAIHTHSPKAGQGMNVSIQDTYNLGWKIAAVINGIAKRSILDTYESERRGVAEDLIAFDLKLSRLYSGRPARDAADETGISMTEFKEVYQKGVRFASGLAVDYVGNILIAQHGQPANWRNGEDVRSLENGFSKVIGNQNLAKSIPMGMRFPSYQVLNQSDSRAWQFGRLLTSDGRFRIILFAGDLMNAVQWQRVQKFGEKLEDPSLFLHRFTPTTKPIDSVFEILTIHSGPRTKLELLDLHPIFHPFDSKKGWNYDKVFVDDVSYHEGHGQAYHQYGVDREKGCVVIIRPDQHVAWIGDLEEVKDMDDYFSNFLVTQS